MKKLFLITALICCTLINALPDGFVYVHDIDPTIQIELRYATNENFLGKPVDGYKKPTLILTKQAAQALKKVQERVKKDGYCLKVYDGYRPQQAVDHFVRWGKDSADQAKKAEYYPRINKADVFELDYVSTRSSHTRGSTVDLTLVKDGQQSHGITIRNRKLNDGFTILFLDDGSIDMGSHFDLFDKASHHENSLIKDTYKKMRTYLKNVMEEHGFKNYPEEWWHFTLKNEPFPANLDSSYFNFPIE